MTAFRQVKASNDAWCPHYIPVVVVFGGTSGIGKAIVRRLAEQLKGRIHIIVVGRNKASCDVLFASLPKAEEGTYEFISCDVTLMTPLHATTATILTRAPRGINYLVLTAGKAFLGPKILTVDGIDSQLVLRFYWKFAVINDLLPGLHAARDRGEAASVLAVLGMGNGPTIDFTDLGCERRHWRGAVPLWQGVSYGDLALALFSERNPQISFTHMFPGMVLTEANRPSAFENLFMKVLTWLLQPLMRLTFIPVDVSAENMVYGLLAEDGGFHQRNTAGDSVSPRNVSYPEKEKEKFWDHCMKMTHSVPT